MKCAIIKIICGIIRIILNNVEVSIYINHNGNKAMTLVDYINFGS